jgi:hypothetical protein
VLSDYRHTLAGAPKLPVRPGCSATPLLTSTALLSSFRRYAASAAPLQVRAT